MQSLESFPTWFSDTMNVTLGTAQVILSAGMIFAFVLPVMYLSSKSDKIGPLPTIFTFLLVESILVGLTWLPFWILIATVALMAGSIAALGTRIVTGG